MTTICRVYCTQAATPLPPIPRLLSGADRPKAQVPGEVSTTTGAGCPVLSAVSSRKGWESTNLASSIANYPTNTAPSFWRGPAEGPGAGRSEYNHWSWVPRPFRSFIAERVGEHEPRFVHCRLSHQHQYRAFFLARTGRRRMAPPQVAGGG